MVVSVLLSPNEPMSHPFFLENLTSTPVHYTVEQDHSSPKCANRNKNDWNSQTLILGVAAVGCKWRNHLFWLNKTKFLSISPLCVVERRWRREWTQTTSFGQSTHFSANGRRPDLCRPIAFKGQIVPTNETAAVRFSRRQGAIFTSGSLGQSSAMAGAGAKRWYFSEDLFTKSPSRRQAVSADKEESYRQQAANFIQDMGQRLQV